MKGKKLLVILGSICLISLVAALPFAASCAEPAPEVKTLKIGKLAALTGFGSAAEALCWEGAQVAEEWFNEQGGITINGQQYLIKLVVEDLKGTADGAVAAANKLVYDHKVKFIVGSVVPYMVAAAGTVTEPAEVLRSIEYNCATPAEYGPDTPYTFMGNDGTVEGNTALLTYVTETYPELKTTVIVIPDDGSIPYLGPIIKRTAEERGLTVLGDVIAWTHDTVDFTPIMAKALALGPDTLTLINGWPAPVGAMLKAAREAGFTGPVTCAHNPCEDILEVAGPAASTNYFATGIVADSPDMTPMIKEIAPRFIEKYGHALYYNYWGFNVVYVLVNAIEAAQSVDHTVVRDNWEKMKTIDSIYGPSTMGGLETYGINHTVCHPVAIQSLMDAQVKHIKWVEVKVP